MILDLSKKVGTVAIEVIDLLEKHGLEKFPMILIFKASLFHICVNIRETIGQVDEGLLW